MGQNKKKNMDKIINNQAKIMLIGKELLEGCQNMQNFCKKMIDMHSKQIEKLDLYFKKIRESAFSEQNKNSLNEFNCMAEIEHTKQVQIQGLFQPILNNNESLQKFLSYQFNSNNIQKPNTTLTKKNQNNQQENLTKSTQSTQKPKPNNNNKIQRPNTDTNKQTQINQQKQNISNLMKNTLNKQKKRDQSSTKKPTELKPQSKTINKTANIDQLSQPITLLLGYPGVGKTTLMNKLFPNQQIEEFKPLYHKQLNCNFVDTRGFNFQESYDSREEQILLFQKFFKNYPNQISDLFIIVNFERTDWMKSKIKEVYQNFKKFSHKITVVVTQFHLSKNKDEDKKHLETNLSCFKAKKIIFIGDDTNEQQILEEFGKVKSNTDLNLSFDLKGTFFENTDKENDQLLKSLQKQFLNL